MTVETARQNLEWILPGIMKQLHEGRYEAPAVRRVYIPKADGGKRPIGVPQVIDRALQRATAGILNEIYEQDFLPCSFGFRPGLSCHHALATISESVHYQRLNFAYEVDIRDFFGSLSHDWLRKFLALRIGDARILKLIDSWLKAGVIENSEWRSTDKGTPQGGSISPLLANIYLHYVLDLWFEKKIRKQLRGKARLVRYCDDFVFLFEKQEDLITLQSLLRIRLAQFWLTIADEKTHTTDIRPNPPGTGQKRRSITFLGFEIFRSKCRNGKGLKTTFKTEGKRFARAKQRMKEILQRIMHWPLEKQAQRINSTLVGHYNYYGIAGNSQRIGSFHYETIRHWRRCLSRRSQRGKLNWGEMKSI
jgi:group II intron reverse transcriptase/maturase